MNIIDALPGDSGSVEAPAEMGEAQDRPGGVSFSGNPYTALLLTERGFNYRDYLASPEWAEKRQAALQRAEHHCQVCNSPHELQVHHRTYERMCAERPADLTVLCRTCHTIFHVGGRVVGLYVEDDAVE